MTIKLYDLCGRDAELRFSPYCWRARLALAHKRLRFDAVPTPFTGVPGIEDGGSKTVPVLNDDGRIVTGSLEIALHLDRAWPDAPTLIDGASGLSHARFLDAWTVGAIHPIVTRMIVKDIHDVLGDEDQRYFRASREARLGRSLEEAQVGVEALADDLNRALAPMAATLAQQPWVGGEAPRFVDYIALAPLQWLRVIAGDVPVEDGAVRGWFDRCLALHGGEGARAKRAA